MKADQPVERVVAEALPRAGLLGNPSDVYQGKAIAFTFRDFRARVEIESAERFELVPGPAEGLAQTDARAAVRRLRELGCDDGLRLVRAALHRLAVARPEIESLPADDRRLRFRLRYASDLPRQVGLAGSSAIVIASLRALARWFRLEIAPFELAELALAAEVQDLGITAGPMDRVAQAYEGLLAMDFREPRRPESYRRLDPESLPPLFIAWDPRVGRASGVVHADVRQRWLRGEPEVRRAMEILPELVDRGLECLARDDHAGFRALVDRNYDTRAAIWTLSDRDRRLVALARARGAAAKLCGSGGAVVGVLPRVEDFAALAEAYAAEGFRALRPEIGGGAP